MTDSKTPPCTTEELRATIHGINSAPPQFATSYQRAALYHLLRGTRERAMHHAWNLQDQDALELLEGLPEDPADDASWEEDRRAGLNVCIARSGVIT